MTEHVSAATFQRALASAPGAAVAPIGLVTEIAGASSRVLFDPQALEALADHPDPTMASAAQVGAQIKVRIGGTWLIANVRSLRLVEEHIEAQVDFLGEGDEEKLTGKLYHFRRGVTRYPTPGAAVYPVSTADLKQIYAADDRAFIDTSPAAMAKRLGLPYTRSEAGQRYDREFTQDPD